MTDTTHQAIIDCARDLLIRRGYRGMNFGDIATALGMTRANIHYHFGSKSALVEAVLLAYVDETLSSLRAIWLDRDRDFAAHVEATLAISLARHARYNPTGAPHAPWSLISRLRHDADLLTPAGRDALSSFTEDLNDLLIQSLTLEIGAGRLAPDLPLADVAGQFTQIADNASTVTTGSKGGERLARLYRGLVALVERGYGTRRA